MLVPAMFLASIVHLLNSKPNGNKQSHCPFLTDGDVKMCSEAFCSKLNELSAGSNQILEKILIYP